MAHPIISKKHWITVAERWQEIPCPMHPWPSEMKIYRQFSRKALNKIKNPKILILGATPEMRDLAHSFKSSEVTCVDIDINMILAMRELMKYKKETEKEIWLKADWTTMPLAKKYYHLILGEAVLGNVQFNRWSKFLNHLTILLRPGGYFINRVVITGIDNWYGQNIDQIFKYTKKNNLNFMELYFLLFCRIWRVNPHINFSNLAMYRTIKKFYNPTKKKYQHAEPYITKLLNQIAKYLPASPYRWSCRSRQVSEKYLKKYFRIVNMKYGKGETPCSVSYHPIYFLKKKII